MDEKLVGWFKLRWPRLTISRILSRIKKKKKRLLTENKKKNSQIIKKKKKCYFFHCTVKDFQLAFLSLFLLQQLRLNPNKQIATSLENSFFFSFFLNSWNWCNRRLHFNDGLRWPPLNNFTQINRFDRSKFIII